MRYLLYLGYMIMHKKGPYILLFSLCFIFILIVGIQYGKYIERQNNNRKNQIDQKDQDMPKEPSQSSYVRYENNNCGFAMVIPDNLNKKTESSTEASFESDKEDAHLDFSCDPKSFSPSIKKNATSSLSLNNKDFSPYSHTITRQGKSLIITDFILTHPQKSIRIHFAVDKSLIPLFQSSFHFL